MIQLFIDKAGSFAEVDLSTVISVPITYQVSDLQKPEVKKSSYSKTIALPGTPRNNALFGHIYNTNSTFGGWFDPNKRVNYRLVRNGVVYSTGYLKMDSITNVSGVMTYNITLYGGIGAFFYSLNEKETLADLTYGIENEGGSLFLYNAKFVTDSWYKLFNNIQDNSVESIITPVPAYTGYYDNFKSDTALCHPTAYNNVPFKTSYTQGIKDYGLLAGWCKIQGVRDISEHEALDLRSYNQPLGVRLQTIYDAIKDPKNNGGYEVDDSLVKPAELDYINKAYLVLPRAKWEDIVEQYGKSYKPSWSSADVSLYDYTTPLNTDFYTDSSEISISSWVAPSGKVCVLPKIQNYFGVDIDNPGTIAVSETREFLDDYLTDRNYQELKHTEIQICASYLYFTVYGWDPSKDAWVQVSDVFLYSSEPSYNRTFASASARLFKKRLEKYIYSQDVKYTPRPDGTYIVDSKFRLNTRYARSGFGTASIEGIEEYKDVFIGKEIMEMTLDVPSGVNITKLRIAASAKTYLRQFEVLLSIYDKLQLSSYTDADLSELTPPKRHQNKRYYFDAYPETKVGVNKQFTRPVAIPELYWNLNERINKRGTQLYDGLLLAQAIKAGGYIVERPDYTKPTPSIAGNTRKITFKNSVLCVYDKLVATGMIDDSTILTDGKPGLQKVHTKYSLFYNTESPLQYLLGLAKKFNWRLYVSDIDGKVHIESYDNYYSGDIVDITGLVDRASVKINPVFNQYSSYTFNNDVPDEIYTNTIWKKTYNRQYGTRVINTDYEFNTDTHNIIENSVYRTPTPWTMNSVYYNGIQGATTWFPVTMGNKYTVTCYAGSVASADDTDEKEYVGRSTTECATLTPVNDFAPRLCMFNSKFEAVDIDGCVAFFNPNGNNTSDRMYNVTDDLPIMWELSDGPTYIQQLGDTSEEWWDAYDAEPIIGKSSIYQDYDDVIGYQVTKIPVFTNWFTTDYEIFHDVYTPESNTEGLPGNASTNVFDTSWALFFSNNYKRDTKVVTAKVHIVGQPELLLKNTYIIDNSAYVINKLKDYDPDKYLTEVEFIGC